MSVTVAPLTDTDETLAAEPAAVTTKALAAGSDAVSSGSLYSSVNVAPSTLAPPASSSGGTVSGTRAVGALERVSA